MNRYLLHISYIGTFFKRFPKTKIESKTIVGTIEEALKTLNLKNEVDVHTISRTDAGVHALNSAVYVDLHRKNNKPFEEWFIVNSLNDFFDEKNHQIRVNKVEIVPDDFSRERLVQSRTYLYRIGVVKHKSEFVIPLQELRRCLFLFSDKFDMDKANEAAQLLVGYHDFRSFMTHNCDQHNMPSYTIRQLNYVKIERSAVHKVHPLDQSDSVEYYDILINGQSFLYRQIRRIVGALIAVAKGKMTKRDVYEMLTIPSRYSMHKGMNVIGSDGLYLADIEFCKNYKKPRNSTQLRSDTNEQKSNEVEDYV